MRRLLLLAGILFLGAVACGPGPASTPTPTATPTPPPPPAATPLGTPSPLLSTPGTLLPSVADVVERVKPSVVSIAVVKLIEECSFFYGCRTRREDSAGTGVIFDPRGYIVTNNHVVEGANTMLVTLLDERTLEAELVGRDPVSDLAVIEIPGEGYPAAEFADPEKLRVGDWVIAIGNALALVGGPTVTLGVVGALDRAIYTDSTRLFDLIQTDAAINSGNSGGPLVNLDGKVVGINSAKETGASGIGFAVSTFTVVPVVESIMEHGRVVFPWLGVGVRDVTPIVAAQENLSASRGALVSSVEPGGPAERAGIQPGDIIVAFDGTEVDNVKQLQRAVRAYAIGEEGEVTVVRGKDTRRIRVSLQEMPRD